MKFLASILITVLLAFIAGLYFPWWSIAITTFITFLLIPVRPFGAFLAGFIALFLLWGILAFWISAANEHILANRVGEVVGVGQNPTALALLTAGVGGLVAGFAALSASFLRNTKRVREK